MVRPALQQHARGACGSGILPPLASRAGHATFMPMSTHPDIYTGTDDFAKLLLSSNVFVDKSLFVKEFLLNSGEAVLITRPRRWGKSLNMNMLGRFLAIEVDQDGQPISQEQSLNRKLFLGGEVALKPGKTKQLAPLNIAQYDEVVEDYQGQFPVISLGLKDIKADSYDKIFKKLRKTLVNLFETHAYLLNTNIMASHERDLFEEYLQEKSDEINIQNSLQFLSKLLHRHFNKPVYILIDEYDTPINHAYLKFKDEAPKTFDQVVELFRDLMGKALKSNEYLKKGLVTGILRIAKANIFSDWNNVREYTLLDKSFAKSYGFTQQEVDTLLNQVSVSTTKAQIQHWYNGYNFGGKTIYNPWSIMCCLSNEGVLDHYWIDSGGTSLVDAMLLKDDIQDDLQRLIRGESVDRIINTKIAFEELYHPNSFYTLLLFSGYLNPEPIDRLTDFYRLSIPNHEVAYIYEKRVMGWVESKLHISSKEYVVLAELLAARKLEGFAHSLQKFLDQAASFQHTGSTAEVFYNGFMLCLLSMLSAYYVIESEYESGAGKADTVLIPKSKSNQNALVLEYKVCEDPEQLPATAQAGLAQILSKDYAAKVRLHDHVLKIQAVSLAFCGKQVAMEYAKIPKL